MDLGIQSGDLAYTRTGVGRPLVLLHGFSGSAAEWAGLIPALTPLRDVVAVDLIGHGRSPAPAAPERYSMERCVADLLALMDALGFEQADLLGYSMGGRVALQLAAAAPARVSALLLESAAPGIADPAERTNRAASDDALAAQIERAGVAWFTDYWQSIALFESQRRLPEELRAELRARRLRNSVQGLAGSLRGMGAGRQTSLWERLVTLTMPTLIISGALDPKYVQIGAAMAAAMPHARQWIVPDAGHTVHLEVSQVFEEIVVGYLQTALP